MRTQERGRAARPVRVGRVLVSGRAVSIPASRPRGPFRRRVRHAGTRARRHQAGSGPHSGGGHRRLRRGARQGAVAGAPRPRARDAGQHRGRGRLLLALAEEAGDEPLRWDHRARRPAGSAHDRRRERGLRALTRDETDARSRSGSDRAGGARPTGWTRPRGRRPGCLPEQAEEHRAGGTRLPRRRAARDRAVVVQPSGLWRVPRRAAAGLPRVLGPAGPAVLRAPRRTHRHPAGGTGSSEAATTSSNGS